MQNNQSTLINTSPNKKKQLDDNPFTNSFRSKTQKAIEIINKHQQEKYNFLKTLTANKKLVSSYGTNQDEQYFNIVQIPVIKIQQMIKIQLLPYSDHIYKLKNPFCVVNNDKNMNQLNIDEQMSQTSSQGTIPLINTGRDSLERKQKSKRTITKKVPKIQLNKSLLQQENSYLSPNRQQKLKIYIKNYRGSTTQIFIYFSNMQKVKQFNIHSHKFIINCQKIINIDIKQRQNKKWIYLRLKSRTQLSMFTLRVQEQYRIKQRKLKTQITELLQSPHKKLSQKKLPKLQTSSSIKSLKNISHQTDNNSSSKLRTSSLNKILLHHQQKQLSPSSKKQNKQLLDKLKKQQLKKRQQQKQKKHQEVIMKKQAVEQSKQKQSKIKSKALQMKKLVEIYKVIHEEQNKYNQYLIPKIAAILFIPTFNKICHSMIIERQKGLKMAWRTRILTKKFTKILKKKYKDSIQHIKNRKQRQLIGLINISTLFGRVLHKNCTQKATNVFLSVLKNNDAGLRLNQSFDLATRYRRAVRVVQKAWQSKYNARLQMLQMYIRTQALNLYTKYPYFKHLQGKFYSENVVHTLAYKYMADESQKVKYLFEDYRNKLKQIEDFKQMNKKIAQFNSTALKKRQKPYLDIPKKPCYPSDRYFRNLSFLKSMIRGWFQLQYRKWVKMCKNSLQAGTQEKLSLNSPSKNKQFNNLPIQDNNKIQNQNQKTQ